MWWKLFVFALCTLLAIVVGGVLLGYFVGGMLMLLSMIAVVEGIRPLKWLVVRSTTFLDLVLLGLSVVLLFNAGVTVAMVVTMAGLAFSFVYAPIIRYRHQQKKLNNNN